MNRTATFLVFGATGATGKHFVAQALKNGCHVRALARTPAKLTINNSRLYVQQGSIQDAFDLDSLVSGVDYVVVLLGDREAQQTEKINTIFMKKLVPCMRKHGVKRLLYQAGAFSCPYPGHLTWVLWMLRYTIARAYEGQHRDNDAVMKYLALEADDIEWIVHRAGIKSDGASEGVLIRSDTKISRASHVDCAAYNYATIMDASAIHTAHFSTYTTS